ncbi:MAG: hypothetical protein PHV20_10835 [Bacteroidales bacterium]|nr:hypothetical protein [Bacteroidales bacterium]
MNSYSLLQTSHSWWAALTIILLFVALTNSVFGMNSKRIFSVKDRKIALIAMTFAHLQLILGLVLYFVSPIGFSALGQMSSAILRLTSLEHPLVGIVAIILITIGWSKHKKADNDTRKFKQISIFYGAGLLLILSRIPWSLWF